MEQMQLGFSYSTPKAVSDRIKKSGKSLLSALQLISYSQVGPQKYRVRSFRPFLYSKYISNNRRHLKNHSDQSEAVLRIPKLHFNQILKNDEEKLKFLSFD